jgi:hypothetical protein
VCVIFGVGKISLFRRVFYRAADREAADGDRPNDRVGFKVDHADVVASNVGHHRDVLARMDSNAFGRAPSDPDIRDRLSSYKIEYGYAVARLVGDQSLVTGSVDGNTGGKRSHCRSPVE